MYVNMLNSEERAKMLIKNGITFALNKWFEFNFIRVALYFFFDLVHRDALVMGVCKSGRYMFFPFHFDQFLSLF